MRRSTSLFYLLAPLLALKPSLAPTVALELSLEYADLFHRHLDSEDEILNIVMSYLENERGRPKPNMEKEMQLLLSDLRSQIAYEISVVRESEMIQIDFPPDLIEELYDEGSDTYTKADSGQKGGENEQLELSPYATIIDHDALLRRLGGLNKYPDECDSGTEEILMSLLHDINVLPNSFRRYNCQRLLQELSFHRTSGANWSERSVLEEFFFAVTDTSPEDETRWKSISLVVSGKWLSDSDYCKWNGITCGVTNVGPGERGIEDDDNDDADCAVIAGVKTCKAKKRRCDGIMDVDQILGIPCPPKNSVTKIDLTGFTFLNGTLSSSLYMLSNLHRLNLMKNNIHSTIPPSYSEFKKLEFLDVSDNHMTAQLPRNLPAKLEEVWFENNGFTGPIPDDFSRFEYLRFIDISNNQISGTIPSFFTQMTWLNSLSLSGNKLTGSIPDFNQISLDVLDFSDNMLSGMPDIFPPDLSELNLASNQLKGKFWDSDRLVTLSYLNVTGNEFTGEVPANLDLEKNSPVNYISYYRYWKSFGCNASTLCKPGHEIICSPGYFSPVGAISQLGPCQVCPLSEEDLKKKMLGQRTCPSKEYVAGDINGDGVLSEREILQLFFVFTRGWDWGSDFRKQWEDMSTSSCDLPGISCNGEGEVIAITPNNAVLCFISENCFGLPSELGLLNSLQILALSGASKLKGTLPTELGQLENLSILKLDKCSSLTGSIPTEFGNMKSLKILDLSSSSFTGSIPTELGRLSDLTTLNLSLNSFSGPIPSTITELKSLKQLVLCRCKLNGRIPESIQKLSQLENLELYGNELTGPFPSALAGLSALKRIDVFSNKLTSTIPADLALLKNLQIIHMRDNLLSGSLPSVIASLPSLSWLDASNNSLTGTIDPGYGLSSTLVDLKLGLNKIHGPIPESLCSAKKMQEGLTIRYGCDAILCPLGTYSTAGYATLTSECKPCPSGQSTLHLGASECVQISQKEILAMFFDVMGGESWDEDQRRGWKALKNECDWAGVICDSNGEIISMEFQMR